MGLYCYDDTVLEGSSRSIILKVTDDWDENIVTWDKATAEKDWQVKGGDIGVTFESSLNHEADGSYKWEEYDISDAVRDLYEAPQKNFGFVIDYLQKDQHHYHSSEYELDKTLRPKLVVTYEDNIENIQQNFIYNASVPGFYVNDCANQIKINALKENITFSVSIYSLSGKCLFSKKRNREMAVINKKAIGTGIGILRIRSQNDAFIQKRIYIR